MPRSESLCICSADVSAPTPLLPCLLLSSTRVPTPGSLLMSPDEVGVGVGLGGASRLPEASRVTRRSLQGWCRWWGPGAAAPP
jgi:hypothetical protein